MNADDFRTRSDIAWLFPETTKNYDRLMLQYRGCCGYALVEYDRLLLPGMLYIIPLEVKVKFYGL